MNLLAQTISSSCFVWVRRLNTFTHTCALQGTLHFAYPMTFATILLTSLLRCGAISSLLEVTLDAASVNFNFRLNCSLKMNSEALMVYWILLSQFPLSDPRGNFTKLAFLTRDTSKDTLTVYVNTSNTIFSGDVSAGFLGVAMNQLTCRDSSIFRCEFNYSSREVSINSRVDEFGIIAKVPPGQMKMTFPEGISREGNSSLVMKCTGAIGSNHTGTQVQWLWEYTQTPDYKWTRYAPDSDITILPAFIDPGFQCKLIQTSILTRILTPEDDNRTYRCYISHKSFDGAVMSYEEFAAVYTVQLGRKDILRPVKGSKEALLIGFVVSGIFALNCAGIIILCYLHKRRERNEQRKRDTLSEGKIHKNFSEDLKDTPEPISVVVYSDEDSMQSSSSNKEYDEKRTNRRVSFKAGDVGMPTKSVSYTETGELKPIRKIK